MVMLLGCAGDDTAGASAETGETGAASDSGDGDGDSACSGPSDCDDANACTEDRCRMNGECRHELIVSNACRPQISVDYPPRAATIEGIGDAPSVEITGNVRSAAGEITSFTVNGDDVDVDANGQFTHTVPAQVGGNILSFDATDEHDQERHRVQSFLWSTEYLRPTTPTIDIAPQGLGIWLSQEVLDDGDRTPPIDDLASILNSALGNLDVSTFFDPNSPIANEQGFDIYITDLRIGWTDLVLTAIDDGLTLQASLNDIDGDLTFDCTNFGCQLLGGDSSGGLSLATLGIEAELQLEVTVDHELQVIVVSANSTLNQNDLDIWSNNGWTNFLLSIIEPLIIGGLVNDLQNELDSQLENVLGPLLGEGLSALAFDLTIEIPSLIGDTPVSVDLITDFDDTDFHDGSAPPDPSPPQGGVFVERGGVYAQTTVTQYDNLGIPQREMCGQGGQRVALDRMAPLELGLSDDLLNQILYAAWRGGMLEFPVDETLVGDVAVGTFTVTDIDLAASGMLAPTASDCEGDLTAHLGDLVISGSLVLNGDTMSFSAYTSLYAGMTVAATSQGLAIGISGVEFVDTQLDAVEDEMIEAEQLVKGVLENALVEALETALGSIGEIALPEIDLSAAVGLPPGTAVIRVMPDSVARRDGTTIVYGTL
jgi:hypothetical protein